MIRTATLRLACIALFAPLAVAADEAPAAAPAATSAATEATPTAEASTAAAESDKSKKVKKLAANSCRKVTGSMLRPQGRKCDSVNGAASQSAESLDAARSYQNQRGQRSDTGP